ncbi:YhcN/YlaJ family sporulation lipoprotein [Caldalkalibacillus mannanilyticus]|uniref:YhcN/YlaJ family sporulation lipoprotein n=1 Tax=Caldalkalibacillus mannanilyticus TaxID=1418 RepID=UPI00046AE72F|nr:YhcN/YlaJ family sporulation lipoprotein [Caldalkalibacillus mannanilyticus]
MKKLLLMVLSLLMMMLLTTGCIEYATQDDEGMRKQSLGVDRQIQDFPGRDRTRGLGRNRQATENTTDLAGSSGTTGYGGTVGQHTRGYNDDAPELYHRHRHGEIENRISNIQGIQDYSVYYYRDEIVVYVRTKQDAETIKRQIRQEVEKLQNGQQLTINLLPTY